ncbi:hypothetical protein ACSNOH_12280 [Streptomyces sp. URMC 127]|uniref:hypothetical protein n=1 Tax=Streptomyces sp. URMC 127 TaxID=3423402 RepID=UPI003F1C1061
MNRVENVLFMRAEDAGTGHQALDRLRRADADGALTLRGAAVIARDAQGSVDFPDTLDTTGTARGFLAGGLIGGLVGILGGPSASWPVSEPVVSSAAPGTRGGPPRTTSPSSC